LTNIILCINHTNYCVYIILGNNVHTYIYLYETKIKQIENISKTTMSMTTTIFLLAFAEIVQLPG